MRLGYTSDADLYADAFRKARQRAIRAAARADDARAVFATAGVTCAQCTAAREVRVRCDAGRLVRPLLIADRVPEAFESLTQLLIAGACEYVDAGAVDDETFWISTDAADYARGAAVAAAAGKPPPSHMEFHPALHMGLSAASIPFAHHNQVIEG